MASITGPVVTGLPAKILAIHRGLDEAALPHAFGGALALAWCTQRARGTIDIDVNVFVSVGRAGEVLGSMPREVGWTARDLAAVRSDGQVRIWWESTPLDLFLSTTDFHSEVAGRARRELFAGAELPFLACGDLAVFKAFFNRTKDWADLEEMVAAGTLDTERVAGTLARFLGPDDERVERLLRLT